MTQRHRQRVGSVVRTGYLGKVQKGRHDVHHLHFVGTAVSGERLLYLHGSIFVQPSAKLYAGQKYDAAGVRDGYARRYVLGKEELLHRHFGRLELVEDFIQPLLEHGEAEGQTLDLGGEYNAEVYGDGVAVKFFFYHAVAHGGETWVNAQNYHELNTV